MSDTERIVAIRLLAKERNTFALREDRAVISLTKALPCRFTELLPFRLTSAPTNFVTQHSECLFALLDSSDPLIRLSASHFHIMLPAAFVQPCSGLALRRNTFIHNSLCHNYNLLTSAAIHFPPFKMTAAKQDVAVVANSSAQSSDDDESEFNLPDPLPCPPTLSTLQHTMKYKPKSTARRIATSLRMFKQIRGRLSKRSVLLLELSGSLSEKPSPPPLPFGPSMAITLPALLSALRIAANDPRIAHLHIRLSPLGVGWGKIMEIRRHLEYFRASGKSISVFMEMGGPKEYFLAMGYAVYVPPEGALAFRGFAVSGSFVRGVLEKIGIEPQVERIGKYKSAGDQLLRKDMSEAQREMLTALLGDVYGVWMKSVSEATGTDEGKLRQFVDESPWDMKRYVDAGLITGICYESEILDALKLRFGSRTKPGKKKAALKKPFASVEIEKYIRRTSEKLVGISGGKKIAVIRFVGAITSGKSGSSPATGSTVGSDTMLDIIRKVRDDDCIVGCIVRCDSPGGSALASDIMWSELRKLGREKPIVASQSDVAASGGYYISMASEIVSEALTITGSVGVVSAKPSLGALYEKIGYTKETISVGSKYAELLVDDRAFNEEELEYFKQGTQLAYGNFVGLAAKSRGKTWEEMDKVAQGRVWTGLQAKEQGMVDHIGGIYKAVEVLKKKLEIDEKDNVQLVEMQAAMSLGERLGVGSGLLQSQASGVNERLLNEPLAMAEVDGLLSGISPITRLVVDSVAAPVMGELASLAQRGGIHAMIAKVLGEHL